MYVITTPDSAAASIGRVASPTNNQPTDPTKRWAEQQHVLQLDLSPLSLSVVIVSQIVHAYRIKPNSSKSLLIEIVLLFHRLQLLDFALLNFSAEHGYMSWGILKRSITFWKKISPENCAKKKLTDMKGWSVKKHPFNLFFQLAG